MQRDGRRQKAPHGPQWVDGGELQPDGTVRHQACVVLGQRFVVGAS